MTKTRNYGWILFILIQEYFKLVQSQSACSTNPQFLGLTFFSESQPVGSVVYNYTMFANSVDILAVTINFPNEFAFNIPTKQLIALVSFNSQSQKLYSLSLTITCPSNTMTFSQNVAILDINNYAAQWQYVNPSNYYLGSIYDNATMYTQVKFYNNNNPTFTDQDTFTSYKIYLLDPLNENAFYLSSTPGVSPVQISTNGTLNYDIRSIYNLTLFLMDLDRNTNYARSNASAIVVINIIDTASKPPIFEFSYYQFQIYNNATNNSAFNVLPKMIKAYDGNIRFNTTINYQLKISYNFLYLNPVSGILYLINPTLPQVFDTTIMAYQYNKINSQTTINVRISILDSNNLIPVRFLEKFVNISIPENKFGSILQLNLSYNTLKSLQFTIQRTINNLQISSGGLVIVVEKFNYELTNFYNLTVIATDSSMKDSMNLLIYILDINEITPTFSTNYYNFRGILALTNNTFNIQIKTYDLNTYLNFQLWDIYGIFNITNSTNNIYLWINNPSSVQPIIYYLTVTVTESGQPPLSNSVNVSVDFTISATSISSQGSLLSLYILLPMIILLILILPIILCHYKKRRVFKSTNAGFTSNDISKRRNIYIKRYNKSPILNENISNVSDVYYSDSYVGKLSKNGTGAEKYRRKMKKDPIHLEINEISFTDNNQSNHNNSVRNSEKISVL